MPEPFELEETAPMDEGTEKAGDLRLVNGQSDTENDEKARPGRTDIGKRVAFCPTGDKKLKFGVLRYYGEPEFAPGVWCGIELDQLDGRNNGSVQGIRYFTCDADRGVFVQLSKVELDVSNPRPKARPDWHKKIGSGKLMPGGNRAPYRKASAPVTNRRQPLKAFGGPKEGGRLPGSSHPVPTRPGATASKAGVPKSASSENLKAIYGDKPVKKSASERNLHILPLSDISGNSRGMGSKGGEGGWLRGRSSSLSDFCRNAASACPSERALSRSSVSSVDTFTDGCATPIEDERSCDLSPASSRGTCVLSRSSLVETIVGDNSAAAAGTGLLSPLRTQGKAQVRDQYCNAYGDVAHFCLDAGIDGCDAAETVLRRVLDPSQPVEGFGVREVVEAVRHHMATCQHTREQLLKQLSRLQDELNDTRRQLSSVQPAEVEHMKVGQIAS